MSEGLWARRFGRDPEILSKTILLNGESHVVIGILGDSPGLRELGIYSDVYLPFQIDPDTADEGNYFKVVARLTSGVTLAQARERLQVFASGNRTRYPTTIGEHGGVTVKSFREALVGDVRPLFLILQGAVVLVLLIACANVANLLLAQATGRQSEIAIRTTIGAAKGRVISQLLTESLLLSFTGGALRMAVGHGGIRALLAMNTAALPLVGPNGSAVNIDWRVAGFALTVSLLTGVLFGLSPALQASRADLTSLLKNNSGRSGTGLRRNRWRAALVGSQTSMAVILLVGSALLIRSFVALYRFDRGFKAKDVVTMRTSPSGSKYLKATAMADTIRLGLDRIRSLPGVVAASATCCLPLQGGYGLPFEIVGLQSPTAQDVGATWSTVSPGFFGVFNIPIKRGRTFTDRDDATAPPVVVINEHMAREYWQGRDPLQDRIVIGRGFTMKEFQNKPPRQIVGIVGDVRHVWLNSDPVMDLRMYIPQAQLSDAQNSFLLRGGPLAWAIRTQGDPHGLVPAIQDQLRRTTGLPVSDLLSMDQVLSLSTGQQRFCMFLMTAFGAAALLLAAIGICGLMAYTVELRRHEIGIRLALGADASHVRNMVVRQGMRLALAGVLVGLGIASALSRVLKSQLYRIGALDPIAFLAIPMVLSAVALFAVSLPANYASRLNPIDSLRSE